MELLGKIDIIELIWVAAVLWFCDKRLDRRIKRRERIYSLEAHIKKLESEIRANKLESRF